MPTVIFTQNLQRHVACPSFQSAGATVREVLNEVFAANPAARSYVLDEHGALRHHMVICVNGAMIHDRTGLSDTVPADGEVYVLQALSGG